MANDFKVGEDWTDSVEDFATTGTLASGAQTITGAVDATGEITSPSMVQDGNQVLDTTDLIAGGGTIVDIDDIINEQPGAPVSTFPGMIWYDTGNHILKIRNEADDDWLEIFDLDNEKPNITNLTDEVTGLMLAPAVAGDGLSQDGVGNLDVNVDGTTIEIDTDVLQIVADNAEVTNVRVSANDSTPGILNGKLVAGTSISLTEGTDGGDETLTIASAFKGCVLRDATGYNTEDLGTMYGVSPYLWDTEMIDTDGFHEGITNPERITIPAGVSRVKLTASIDFSTLAVDEPGAVAIQKNALGVNYNGRGITSSLGTGSGLFPHVITAQTAVIDVVATDYFQVSVTNLLSAGATGIVGYYFMLEVIE